MISYAPLRATLAERSLEMSDLILTNGGIFNPRTVNKLKANETVNIETIERICIHLEVPIEKVIKVTK